MSAEPGTGRREPRELDLERWERREHFRFFQVYDWPFFNLCADVDVTSLVRRTAEPDGPSFFLASLFLSLKAANELESFRLRIRGGRVVVHERIDGGSTVLREDGTFGFAYFDWRDDFGEFAEAAGPVLEAARQAGGPLEPRDDRDDLIHYSVIPWVAFTSFAHARRRREEDSVPKVVFGRHHAVGDRRRLPVSVEVHHALMDGLHVGRFFERFQALLDAGEP